MLDLNYVRDNLQQVYDALEKRGASEDLKDLLSKFSFTDKGRRDAIAESDRLNAERNKLSRQIGELMKLGKAEVALSLRGQVGVL